MFFVLYTHSQTFSPDLTDLLPVLNDVEEPITFISLKKRLCAQLYGALCFEKDSTNTQMLLGEVIFMKLEGKKHSENSQMQNSSTFPLLPLGFE